jgi:hypothetical protein
MGRKMRDRQMAWVEPGLAERDEPEVLEVREEAEEARTARADLPRSTNSESTLRRQLEIVRNFEEHWALYRTYCAFAPDGAHPVLTVAFQCVVDHDTNAVEELLGIVAV